MTTSNAPIGVMDAGLGGYTVVKELQALLPHEEILYFGDGKYQPYGNRSKEEILFLTRQMLTFLQSKGVKAVAIACNTISTLLEEYQSEFPFPIFSIVRAGSDDVIAAHPQKAVMLSTVFTAKSGCYEQYIRAQSPQTQVIAQGCPKLARLIEDGDFDLIKIEAELHETLGRAAAAHPDADMLVLGCTHFPLIADVIKRLYPQFTQMIDPAATLSRQIKAYLQKNNLLQAGGEGNFQVYTTSDCDVYRRIAISTGLKTPRSVELVSSLRLPTQ